MSEPQAQTTDERPEIAAIRARCSQNVTEMFHGTQDYYRYQQIARDRSALLAEVDRLRAALEKISNLETGRDDFGLATLQGIANAALSGNSHD